MKIKTEIEAIDVLSSAVITYIDTLFLQEVLDKNEHKLVDKTLTTWFKVKGNFFSFYEFIDKKVRMEIFEALEIESFYDVINRYISFCNSSSPVILKDISPSAWQTVQENEIDLYGDVKDWSVFWVNATVEGKRDFLNYIENKFTEALNELPF